MTLACSPAPQRQRGMGVAQVVQADARQPSLGGEADKQLGETVGVKV
jgi:hypothetical protein